MKFKVVVVQFRINQFQPEKNLKKAEKFIQKASGKADIIVFPEDFITGPIFGKEEFVDFEGKYRQHFQLLARKYKIDIVPGSFVEGQRGGWYNTTYFIDRTGKIKGVYRKVNLWLPERKEINPGNEIAVFNTRYGKVGLTICWDLIFPEIFRRMLQRGAQIIFCPSYWLRKDARHGLKWNAKAETISVNSLCSTRAVENGIILVYANFAGDLKTEKIDDESIGCSQITVPFRGVLNKLDHNREAMFIQEIDTSILEDAERAYKIRADLKKRVF